MDCCTYHPISFKPGPLARLFPDPKKILFNATVSSSAVNKGHLQSEISIIEFLDDNDFHTRECHKLISAFLEEILDEVVSSSQDKHKNKNESVWEECDKIVSSSIRPEAGTMTKGTLVPDMVMSNDINKATPGIRLYYSKMVLLPHITYSPLGAGAASCCLWCCLPEAAIETCIFSGLNSRFLI